MLTTLLLASEASEVTWPDVGMYTIGALFTLAMMYLIFTKL
jgi:hypothetical protein